MTTRKLGYIAFRILSIVLGLRGLSTLLLYLGSATNNRFMQTPIKNIIVSSIGHSIYLIAGLVLWFKAKKYVDAIVSRDDDGSNLENLSLDSIQAIAFSTVGIVMALNSIIYLYMTAGVLSITLGEEMDLVNMFLTNFGGRVITLVIGLILLFRPKVIMRFTKIK